MAQCETLHLLSTTGTSPPHYSIRHPPLSSLTFFPPYLSSTSSRTPVSFLTFPDHLHQLPTYQTALSYKASLALLLQTRNPVLHSCRWPTTGAHRSGLGVPRTQPIHRTSSHLTYAYRVEHGVGQHHLSLSNDALHLLPTPSPPRTALFESDAGQRHIFYPFNMGHARPSELFRSQRGFLVHRRRVHCILQCAWR